MLTFSPFYGGDGFDEAAPDIDSGNIEIEPGLSGIENRVYLFENCVSGISWHDRPIEKHAFAAKNDGLGVNQFGISDQIKIDHEQATLDATMYSGPVFFEIDAQTGQIAGPRYQIENSGDISGRNFSFQPDLL